ncbi:cytochrome P450 2J2-like [Dreissena polymorpha]|uniref:Cytochrome P450 n=1 Tax=Dreissena polymorpha TaxID=45954 RepID=A0A9D4K9D5_DREPO|nr:cytochrome P450 2J2-like [Dreissena polymorpha]KAH3835359.1 hypothetical protein DPMN_108708 [Dreissena polymorpha]
MLGLADIATWAFSSSWSGPLFVGLVTLLITWYFLSNRSLPPGPIRFPLIGSVWWFALLSFRKSRLPVALFNEWKRYGDVVHMSVGNINMVFLNGHDAIHEAFVTRADDFSDRPEWVFKVPYKGLIFESGAAWKNMRKFTFQALRDFGVGKASLEEIILKEVDSATDYLSSTIGEPTSLRDMTSMMVTNVIYHIIFGKRLEFHSQEMLDVLDNMGRVLLEGAPIDVVRLVPKSVLKLVGNKQRKPDGYFDKSATWIFSHINGHIEEHRKTYDGNHIRDFIDLYLKKEMEDSNTDSSGNEAIQLSTLLSTILDLFIAGSDTTSNSLNWCILYLQEYPEVQRKSREEIHEKFGDRAITWSDRGTLPYTEATLLEIQRLGNIAEMSIPHVAKQEVTFRGYRLPANTIVQANLLSSHLDPRYWENPTAFCPERHIENGELKKNPAFTPFSLGPRMCLGETLARMELFLSFTNLLQRFSFRREADHVTHAFDCKDGFLIRAPTPYKTRAIRD